MINRLIERYHTWQQRNRVAAYRQGFIHGAEIIIEELVPQYTPITAKDVELMDEDTKRFVGYGGDHDYNLGILDGTKTMAKCLTGHEVL